jgi:hypothetical protein
MHRKWPKCEILRRSEVAQCGLRAQGTPLRPAAAPAHGGRTRSKGPRNARNSQIYGSRFRPRITPENSGLPRGQGRHTGPSDRLKAGLTRHPLARENTLRAKTPCARSSSYTPPAHEILPLQISSYAIGTRHCVLRLPPVDCLMCCFVRPVSRTSDASDASSRHAFTPSSVSLAASAAAAVLGTRPAA